MAETRKTFSPSETSFLLKRGYDEAANSLTDFSILKIYRKTKSRRVGSTVLGIKVSSVRSILPIYNP